MVKRGITCQRLHASFSSSTGASSFSSLPPSSSTEQQLPRRIAVRSHRRVQSRRDLQKNPNTKSSTKWTSTNFNIFTTIQSRGCVCVCVCVGMCVSARAHARAVFCKAYACTYRVLPAITFSRCLQGICIILSIHSYRYVYMSILRTKA